MDNRTQFIFTRGMIHGLANSYKIDKEDLNMLLEQYDQLNPEVAKELKEEGLA